MGNNEEGKVTGGFKELLIEEVPALYSILIIIRLIKSISKSLAGECCCAWERREMGTHFLVARR